MMRVELFMLLLVSLVNIVISQDTCISEANVPYGAVIKHQFPYLGSIYELWECKNSGRKEYFDCTKNKWHWEELKCGPKPVFKDSCLSTHNNYRDLHSQTDPLTYSDELAQSAQVWADHIAAISQLEHDSNRDAGENMYFTSTRNSPYDPCGYAIEAWYKEYLDYSYTTTRSTNGNSIGHFTQVVWKSTMAVGCGVREVPSPSGGNTKTYVVCRYSPEGNYVFIKPGESYEAARVRVYGENVKPLKPGADTGF